MESPAGVGWSYSNRTSDYTTGDNSTGHLILHLNCNSFLIIITLTFKWSKCRSPRHVDLHATLVDRVSRVQVPGSVSDRRKLCWPLYTAAGGSYNPLQQKLQRFQVQSQRTGRKNSRNRISSFPFFRYSSDFRSFLLDRESSSESRQRRSGNV